MDLVLKNRLIVENVVVAVRQSMKVVKKVDQMKRRKAQRRQKKIFVENNHESGVVVLIWMADISGDKIRFDADADDDADNADADNADAAARIGGHCLQPIKRNFRFEVN